MKKIFQNKKMQKIAFIAILFLIFSIGAFARFWQLNEIPPGLHYDEAYNGIDAVKALENKDFKVFYPGNNGREGLYINTLALFLDNFGVSNFSLRMASSLFGLFTLVGFFLLLRELRFSKISILLGVLLIATSFWHINFSHIVYRGIMAPFLLVWILWLFFLGLRKNNIWILASSGALLGVGFHTYISFRVAPLIIVIIAGALFWIKKGFFKKYWKGAAVFLLASLIVASPIFYYFYQNQDQLVGRSNDVSVFNAPGESFPVAFGKSLLAHLNAFYTFGDPNQRHNHAASPLIPPAWTALFTLGFIFSLKEIFKTFYGKIKKKEISTHLFVPAVVAQSVFWVMLIPGVLSIEGIPHSLRIIGVIPAVFIFTVLPFEYMNKLKNSIKNSPDFELKPKRFKALIFSLSGLVVIVFLAGITEVYTYYFVWSKEPETLNSFARKKYEFGKAIKELPTKKDNFLVIPEGSHISSDRKSSSFKSAEFSGYPEIKNFLFIRSVEVLKNGKCENTLYVFFEMDEWLRNGFKEKCPKAEFQKKSIKDGYYDFWVMEAERT
ncbi:MAG: glycosyltransferase family 39 protein [Candidatus Moraniibacteriota bacterium]